MPDNSPQKEKKKAARFGKTSARIRIHRQTEPGALPGTVVAPPEAPKPIVDLILYNESSFQELKGQTIEQLRAHASSDGVTTYVNWLNIDGLGDAEIVKQIGDIFQLHPLALEDVVNVHQRPKLEEYDDFLFITARMPILSSKR